MDEACSCAACLSHAILCAVCAVVWVRVVYNCVGCCCVFEPSLRVWLSCGLTFLAFATSAVQSSNERLLSIQTTGAPCISPWGRPSNASPPLMVATAPTLHTHSRSPFAHCLGPYHAQHLSIVSRHTKHPGFSKVWQL